MNSSELFEVKRTPIPLWKWILLHFGKNYRSVDCEGDIVSVITAKYMFKVLWIWEEEIYNIKTGVLLRHYKLTRKD